ncbi:hypothetical protein [Wolbachia endosymbiont (group A) of Dendrolimus pini]
MTVRTLQFGPTRRAMTLIQVPSLLVIPVLDTGMALLHRYL